MTTPDIIGLIGSRICHDIISPLGAIGNGVELMSLSGSVQEAEMALVTDSVSNATAKVRFFRLAFGAATQGATVARSEIVSILDGLSAGGRLRYVWHPTEGAARSDVRAVFLALLCMETALPLGGEVEVNQLGDGWAVSARNPRLSLDPSLWEPLSSGAAPVGVAASTVHFALLPIMLGEEGRRLRVEHGADWALIRF